ncbi:UvrD-helicase domain-containing protein [Sphingomonas daechungensis]|uniref:UvrD-helicase domain-containing protein n=1 Tax=Sphingomonas daechungensis TaxID=1176646 RepID=UPI001CB999BF|nr:UvrD-helicase domain-containing protein [Sphingomonas daechungensis]
MQRYFDQSSVERSKDGRDLVANPEQLDPDQQDIVSLPLEGSHLVIGPPGSGKTNLLLLRASYLTRAGRPNIAVITFGRVLREFLATGAGNYPFEPRRLQTFRTWAVDLLKANGDNVDTTGKFPEIRRRIMLSLTDLAGRSGAELRFDCILVDEAQDYTIEEIKIIRSFCDEIFAVGDNDQRIYESDGALGYLGSVCNVAPELKYHYRNGTAICILADGIMNRVDGGMLETCNYDESTYPSTVRRLGGLALSDQIAAAVPELETQLVAYPNEWIGVLAPLKVDVGRVFEALSDTAVGDKVQLQRYEDGYDTLDREKPIIVTTMHSAKGWSSGQRIFSRSTP